MSGRTQVHAPTSPDAEAWGRVARAYTELRHRLTALLEREGLTPELQRELLVRIEASAQATQHARKRAATLEAETARGGAK